MKSEDSYFTGYILPMSIGLPCYPPRPKGSDTIKLKKPFVVCFVFSHNFSWTFLNND